VQRWRCVRCGVTSVRPSPGSPRRSGPIPGGGRSGATGRYQRFWDLVLAGYSSIGLHPAVTEAAHVVGISRPTASRWVKRPRADLSNLSQRARDPRVMLLEAALDVLRGNWPDPTETGIDDWRRARAGRYRELAGMAPEGGRWGYRSVEEQGFAQYGQQIWQLLQRASSVAAVVLGDSGPLGLTGRVSAPRDAWLEELHRGGLAAREPRTSRFRYWLAFGPSYRDVVDDWAPPPFDCVSAVVTSKSRVIGGAAAVFGEWRAMTVRLNLGGAAMHGSELRIPVPSAGQRYKGELRTYDLPLRLKESMPWRLEGSSFRADAFIPPFGEA